MSETAQDSQGCSQHLWGGISILLQHAFPWLQFEAPWTAEAAAQPRSCPFALGHCCTQLAGATPKICRAGATQVTKSKILAPKLIKILTATLFSLSCIPQKGVAVFIISFKFHFQVPSLGFGSHPKFKPSSGHLGNGAGGGSQQNILASIYFSVTAGTSLASNALRSLTRSLGSFWGVPATSCSSAPHAVGDLLALFELCKSRFPPGLLQKHKLLLAARD